MRESTKMSLDNFYDVLLHDLGHSREKIVGWGAPQCQRFGDVLRPHHIWVITWQFSCTDTAGVGERKQWEIQVCGVVARLCARSIT
jgi:hypothetical protein